MNDTLINENFMHGAIAYGPLFRPFAMSPSVDFVNAKAGVFAGDTLRGIAMEDPLLWALAAYAGVDVYLLLNEPPT